VPPLLDLGGVSLVFSRATGRTLAGDGVRLSRYSWFPCHGTRAVADPHPTGASVLSEVIIHEDENFERALKRFKKKCEKAGILSDLRKHRHYEKPSERRKRKMNAAVRKNRRTRHG
jgi:small subunit ribosomal protein S21